MSVRITRENAKALGPAVEALVEGGKARRPSKYRNVHTTYNGVLYSSKAEAAHAAKLDAAVAAGAVRWWVRQVVFRLGCPENKYVVDMVVVPAGAEPFAVDVKGNWSLAFKRHARLWRKYGVCDLHVVMKGKTEIIPGGLAR